MLSDKKNLTLTDRIQGYNKKREKALYIGRLVSTSYLIKGKTVFLARDTYDKYKKELKNWDFSFVSIKAFGVEFFKDYFCSFIPKTLSNPFGIAVYLREGEDFIDIFPSKEETGDFWLDESNCKSNLSHHGEFCDITYYLLNANFQIPPDTTFNINELFSLWLKDQWWLNSKIALRKLTTLILNNWNHIGVVSVDNADFIDIRASTGSDVERKVAGYGKNLRLIVEKFPSENWDIFVFLMNQESKPIYPTKNKRIMVAIKEGENNSHCVFDGEMVLKKNGRTIDSIKLTE